MAEAPRSTVTRILAEGNRTAFDGLVPVVYEEMRSLAAADLRREAKEHTLQPTALAHEAYLRLVDETKVQWRGRAQFLAIAARAMRQILVDHARTKGAAKRGGGWERITLHDAAGQLGHPLLDLLALDEALEELAKLDARKARVVEMRFFSGLTNREAAEALEISEATTEDDWFMARAWLKRRLGA